MLQRLRDEAHEAPQDVEPEAAAEAQQAIDATSARVAILDPEGRVIAVNRAWRVFDDPGAPPWARRLGEGESYLGSCEDVPEGACFDESGDVAAGVRAVLRGEREAFSLEYPSQARDARRWFVMRVTRLPGPPWGALVAHEDITERRQAEQAARHEQAQLARHDHALAELGRALAQDLRDPIRSIGQLAGWIEEDSGKKLSRTGRHHLELLRDRVERADVMISALVDYIHSGGHPGPPLPVDVGRLLEKMVRTMALAPEVTVEIARPMPVLRTARGILQRVFFEIIAHALTHQGARHVLVSASRRDTTWVFEVHDDGASLDEPQRVHLAGIFQSHDEDPRRANLGLVLAHRLLEERGGALSLRSRVGEGTTVRFTWPD